MTALILIVVVVVVVAAFFAMRKKPEELPPTTDAKPTPKPIAAAAAKEPAKAEPKAESAPAAEKSAETATAKAAEPEPVKAAEPEKPAARPSRPVKPLAKSSADEVDAFRKGLAATRGGFFARIRDLFGRKPEVDPAALDELEEILLSSDVGATTTQGLLAKLREKHAASALASAAALEEALRAEVREILGRGAGAVVFDQKPTVIVFVGVNGVGKTTTIGKLAAMLKESGKKVLLAAGDTYRAAAVVQLEAWARRSGCDVLKGKERADPSGVLFDAVQKGINEGYDVVLCDTAGRLQTKTPLMDELAKMGRSVEKALGRPADEVLLVLDATTGQNAVQQAKQFGETLPLSGIVLTKLDGTAKGGVILGVVEEQKVAVRYVGVGEKVEDLRLFEPEGFVDALFDPRTDG